MNNPDSLSGKLFLPLCPTADVANPPHEITDLCAKGLKEEKEE